MKRIQYHRYGGPEELRLEDAERPSPAKGEVLVRVVAASANPMDWGFRRGDAKLFTGSRFPRGLGHDFAGVVEAVGAGVDAFSAGDEVLGATDPRQAGAFAEAIVVKQKHVFRKPPGLPFEQAAALTITGMTAHTALIGKAKLRHGQSVFVAGCLGGVGRAGVQIALGRGARVAGSCSAAGRQEALALGVEEAVDYRTFDAAAFSARFDVVFDAAGALSPGQCDVMLKRGGVALHVTKPLSNMVRFLFSRRHHAIIARQDPQAMAELIAAAVAGRLCAAIGRKVLLADAIPALVQLEVHHQPKGKLLIEPGGGDS